MGKFNQTKWKQAIQDEYGLPPLDVVRGYAADRVSFSLCAQILGLSRQVDFLRRLVAQAGIVFQGGTIFRSRPEGGDAETAARRRSAVIAWHRARGHLPLSELSEVTGIKVATINQRRHRGMPKHRWAAASWPADPARQGGRRTKC